MNGPEQGNRAFRALRVPVLAIVVSALVFAGSVFSEDDIVWETRYETRRVERTVVVTPEEYLSDADGDGLVDAIDPHPDRPERDFFTDSDGDAVADAFDLHPGEDDFAFSERDTDADGNGIIDSYERIPVF